MAGEVRAVGFFGSQPMGFGGGSPGFLMAGSFQGKENGSRAGEGADGERVKRRKG